MNHSSPDRRLTVKNDTKHLKYNLNWFRTIYVAEII